MMRFTCEDDPKLPKHSTGSKVSQEGDFKGNKEEKRKQIQGELSTMSFEDLQKLKNEMGSKVYNTTIFGDKKNEIKHCFKRANKNRPREISSKKAVKLENTVFPGKTQLARDPRFESMCGTFDRNTFKHNYKFVNDLRKKEKSQLENELKNIKTPEQKNKIKFVIQRLDNQIRDEEIRDGPEQQGHKKQKLSNNEDLKSGEKPHFKKKSVKRLESLISKYENLKKTNQIQKHIERRSKKISAKERKKLQYEKIQM